jgi:hypothetical protein
VSREAGMKLCLLISAPGTRLDEGRVHRAVASARNDTVSPAGREWFLPTDDVRRVVEAFGGMLL